MSISDKELRKQLVIMLAATLFLVLVGAVYERFGHGVYSYYMIYAFVPPLVMGVVPYTALLLRQKTPDRLFLNLWNSSIATLATGSVFKGALDISGYTNSMTVVYLVVGIALAAAAVISLAMRRAK